MDKKATLFLFTWVIVLSILYAMMSVVRHNTFQSGGFDLGIYDQSVWQYSRFLAPYSSIKERLVLGDHLALTLPLLAPLFWIWNDVRMLLSFQALWVSVSSIAIFLLARHRGFRPFSAFCISIIYSLFYGIQFLIFFDFHPVTIGVGLMPWVVYFLETKRNKLLIMATALLLLTQENMGIALASLGFLYVFKKSFRKEAIGFIIVGVVFSLLALKTTEMLSPIGYEYNPVISLNPIQIAVDLFNSEEKRLVWFYSFGWFSFLPLLSPGALLAVFLDLAQYFVTGPDLSRMWSPYMHHRAILGVLLTLGTLDTFLFLKKRFRVNLQYVSLALVFIMLIQQYVFHFPLNKLIKKAYWRQESWMEDSHAILKTIPNNVSIATQQNLVPHLSHRKEIYLLWPRKASQDICGKENCWWLYFGGKPEYMLVNVSQKQSLVQLLESPEHFVEAVENMEEKERIRLVKKVGDARLYKVSYWK